MATSAMTIGPARPAMFQIALRATVQLSASLRCPSFGFMLRHPRRRSGDGFVGDPCTRSQLGAQD